MSSRRITFHTQDLRVAATLTERLMGAGLSVDRARYRGGYGVQATGEAEESLAEQVAEGLDVAITGNEGA